ncbi:hypothetical protein KI387_019826, partial [Taxus chinensis]
MHFLFFDQCVAPFLGCWIYLLTLYVFTKLSRFSSLLFMLMYDYEEDVLNNNFNVLRMFAKLYGPSKAPSMLARYISEAEDKYQKLLNQLHPSLASAYQKRCEEAVSK